MRFKEISSIFLHFGGPGSPPTYRRKGWESNIGTSILPRRKVKKMPKELEAHANELKTQVTSLDLNDCGQFTDIGLFNLSRSESLTHLKINGCNLIRDKGITFLSDMQTLESLNLWGCDGVTDDGL